MFVGLVFSFIAGIAHPMIGVSMAGMMSTLTAPIDKAWIVAGLDKEPDELNWGNKWLKSEITEKWCVFFACLALYTGTC